MYFLYVYLDSHLPRNPIRTSTVYNCLSYNRFGILYCQPGRGFAYQLRLCTFVSRACLGDAHKQKMRLRTSARNKDKKNHYQRRRANYRVCLTCGLPRNLQSVCICVSSRVFQGRCLEALHLADPHPQPPPPTHTPPNYPPDPRASIINLLSFIIQPCSSHIFW